MQHVIWIVICWTSVKKQASVIARERTVTSVSAGPAGVEACKDKVILIEAETETKLPSWEVKKEI